VFTVVVVVVVVGVCVTAVAVEMLSGPGHQPATADAEPRSGWDPWRSMLLRLGAAIRAAVQAVAQRVHRRGRVAGERLAADAATTRRASRQLGATTGRQARQARTTAARGTVAAGLGLRRVGRRTRIAVSSTAANTLDRLDRTRATLAHRRARGRTPATPPPDGPGSPTWGPPAGVPAGWNRRPGTATEPIHAPPAPAAGQASAHAPTHGQRHRPAGWRAAAGPAPGPGDPGWSTPDDPAVPVDAPPGPGGQWGAPAHLRVGPPAPSDAPPGPARSPGPTGGPGNGDLADAAPGADWTVRPARRPRGEVVPLPVPPRTRLWAAFKLVLLTTVLGLVATGIAVGLVLTADAALFG
jgi:hypothetical protein